MHSTLIYLQRPGSLKTKRKGQQFSALPSVSCVDAKCYYLLLIYVHCIHNIAFFLFGDKFGINIKLNGSFKKPCSTTDHLVRLENAVRAAFVHKQHCLAVFCDLEKAYDATWRSGILQHLDELGVRAGY